jgi:hypothetical protein
VALIGLILIAFGPLALRASAQGDEKRKAALQQLILKAEDEYRLFFHKPKTVFEFWAAIEFELKTGKYDVAGYLLGKLVKEQQPKDKVDEKLLEIEEVRGMTPFLKLNTVKQWNANPDLQKEAEQNVKELIDRITKALDKSLSDPVRIRKLIAQLDAPTFAERAYAFKQLKRTKYRAAPYLVEALIKTAGKKENQRIQGTMLLLDADIMQPIVEILKPFDEADYKDIDLRATILDVFRVRDDRSAIPYLYHMSASTKYPPLIRLKAKETLASLLRTSVEALPEPREALTKLATQYYHHQVRFAHVLYDDKSEEQYIKYWAWTKGQALEGPDYKSVTKMEQLLAMRHAQEALDLDPNYRPAKKLMLTLILDQTYGKSLDKFLYAPLPPELNKLLTGLDSDFLIEVLQAAMNEHNMPVILPIVRVLGERGESKAALPSLGGAAQGLVKALFYPDRRVQLAAIRALINLPAEQSSPVKVRIVELLQRLVLAEQSPKALVIHAPEGQEKHLRDALKKAGYVAELTADRKQAFAQLHQSGDFDCILIHGSYPPAEMPYLLAELHGDTDAGLLPILILATPENIESLNAYKLKYRNVFVIQDGLTTKPLELKRNMQDAYKLAAAPNFLKDVPEAQMARVVESFVANKGIELTGEERKRMSEEAMDLLWRMSHSTYKGFSLHPAKKTLLAMTFSKDTALAEKAIDAIGVFPGGEVQQRLATLVLDKEVDKKLRVLAAYKLHKHVLEHSLLLTKVQVVHLREAAEAAGTDPELQAPLLLLASRFPKAPGKDGPKLGEFTPKPVK